MTNDLRLSFGPFFVPDPPVTALDPNSGRFGEP